MKPNYYMTIQLKDKTLWTTEGFSIDDGINNLIDETNFDKQRFIKQIHSIIAKNFKTMTTKTICGCCYSKKTKKVIQ